jgi:NAD(P)-dependent dehydrogenase (short-subunit alcohol dehydrogenase family)
MPHRVALVTSASRGVGKGIALELCDADFRVYTTCVRKPGQFVVGRLLLPCDYFRFVRRSGQSLRRMQATSRSTWRRI